MSASYLVFASQIRLLSFLISGTRVGPASILVLFVLLVFMDLVRSDTFQGFSPLLKWDYYSLKLAVRA